jgi:protein-S-isoprenylcysteine O-methyltransferase Ste14
MLLIRPTVAATPLVIAELLWAGWGLRWMAAAGFICLFAEAPTGLAYRWRLWSLTGPLAWLAVGVVAIGFAFAWWARIHLGKLWSGLILRRRDHRIVDTGPYAVVRHPIYTGLILGAAALAALKATPLALIGVALIALGFGLKARVEERFLGAELGEAAYAAYRRRVPMLIPLWRASR